MSGKLPLFGSKKPSKEDTEGENEIYSITVQFKMNPEDKFETCDDIVYDHFPSEEEIREEYGGGIWQVIARNRNNKIIKRRRYVIEDVDITYPIRKYKIKIKKDMKSKWFSTDLEYNHFPTEEELETDLGGGGIIKVIAVDKNNKTVSSKLVKIDAEPPEWLIEMEDDTQKVLKETLQQQRKKQEEKIIKKIAGEEEEDEDAGKDLSRVGKALNKLISSFEELQLEKFEEIVEKLTKKDESHQPQGRPSFTEVLFIEPQVKKLEALTYVAKRLADKDPERAAELLEKIPDASAALISLISAGGAALNAFSKVLNVQAAEKMKKLEIMDAEIKEDKKEVKKEPETKKEEPQKEIKKKGVEMSVEETGKGYEIVFGVEVEE